MIPEALLRMQPHTIVVLNKELAEAIGFPRRVAVRDLQDYVEKQTEVVRVEQDEIMEVIEEDLTEF
jgi:hypothetical protein